MEQKKEYKIPGELSIFVKISIRILIIAVVLAAIWGILLWAEYLL